MTNLLSWHPSGLRHRCVQYPKHYGLSNVDLGILDLVSFPTVQKEQVSLTSELDLWSPVTTFYLHICLCHRGRRGQVFRAIGLRRQCKKRLGCENHTCQVHKNILIMSRTHKAFLLLLQILQYYWKWIAYNFLIECWLRLRSISSLHV